MHEKAVKAALLTAATCYDAGSWSSAAKWARRSQDNFERYYNLSKARAQNKITLVRTGQVAAAGAVAVGLVASGGLATPFFVGTASGTGGLGLGLSFGRVSAHKDVIARLESERDVLTPV